MSKKYTYHVITAVILTQDSFDANASSTKMNFNSHAPIHNPGANDEARTFKESSSDGTDSTQGYDRQQPEQNGDYDYQYNENHQQPTPAQQFDPYYAGAGLDATQLPDQMYGDSQESQYHDDEAPYDQASWEGSYDQSSGTGSASYESYDQGQDPHTNNDVGSFASVESAGISATSQSQPSQGSRRQSLSSVDSSVQSEYSDSYEQPKPGVDSNYNNSGSSLRDEGQYDEEYDGDDQQYYDDDEEYTSREGDSYDEEYSGGEEEGLLPPVT